MPIPAIMMSTAGGNSIPNGASENEMSQCRRGTPKIPEKVIDIAIMVMPAANRYG